MAVRKPQVLVFSPPTREEKKQSLQKKKSFEQSKSTPVLTCAKFQGGAYLEFGTVQTGIESRAKFKLEVPQITKGDVLIATDKIPTKKGFAVDLGDGEQKVSVSSDTPVFGWVIWCPLEPGPVREVCSLKMNGKFRLQITCRGTATGDNFKDLSLLACDSVLASTAVPKGRTLSMSSIRSPSKIFKNDASPVPKVAESHDGWLSADSDSSLSNIAASPPKLDSSQRSEGQRNVVGQAKSLTVDVVSPIRLSSPSLQRSISQGSPIQKGTGLYVPFPSAADLKPPPPTLTSRSRGRSWRQASFGATSVGDTASEPAPSSRSSSRGPPSLVRVGSTGGDRGKLLRKIIFDEAWADKQEVSFTTWLNYILRREEDFGGLEEELEEQVEGVEMDQLGFRQILLRRYEANVRHHALALYHSDEIYKILAKVEERIHSGKLAIRSERNIHADVGLRSFFMDLMISYSTPWLRLGLETVFGEIISYANFQMPEYTPGHTVASKSKRRGNAVDLFNDPKDKKFSARKRFSTKPRKDSMLSTRRDSMLSTRQDSMLSSRRDSTLGSPNKAKAPAKPRGRKLTRRDFVLKKFVEERVLADPTLRIRYAKVGKNPHGKWGKELITENLKHTLRRFLQLVLFLDRAKVEGILSLTPCLWKKDSKVKSSSEVLTEFCREYLSGEGDFLRHLKTLKYKVEHTQQPIDEFDFTVKNLSVDLRDGVRLVRLVELLTKQMKFPLSRHVRLPADSRLRKVYNVDLALDVLKEEGTIPENFNAKHIVDGNREKTLSLLWQIILKFKVCLLIDWRLLKREIAEIKLSSHWRDRHAFGLELVERRLAVGTEEVLSEMEVPNEQDADMAPHLMGLGENPALLLQWAQAICLPYGVQVHNFTTSFADGRVFCLLVHFYHRSALALEDICQTTAHLQKSNMLNEYSAVQVLTAEEDLLSDPNFENENITEESIKRALKGERANVELAKKCVGLIGGVPDMLNTCDSVNLPEEKTVIVYLAYLCARLMESSNEIRAAIVLQRMWRRYLIRKAVHQRDTAAWAIFLAWKRNRATIKLNLKRRYWWAVKKIEQWYILHTEEWRCQQSTRNHAAIWIQAGARRYLMRKRFLEARSSSVIVQKSERGRQARERYAKIRLLIIHGQALVRGFQARRKYYGTILKGIVMAQSRFRGVMARQWYRRTLAAIGIQKMLRRWLAVRLANRLRELKAQNETATALQAWLRQSFQTNAYLRNKASVIKAQAICRGMLARHLLRKLRKQQLEAMRDEAERRECAATRLQANFRTALAVRQFQSSRRQAINIQTACRVWLCQRRYQHLLHERRKDAAVRLQAAVRRFMAVRNYGAASLEVRKLQAAARSLLCRKRLSSLRSAAIVAQACARGFLVRQWLRRRHQAAALIQKVSRKWIVRRKFLMLVNGLTKLQSCLRGRRVKSEVAKQVTAASQIQKIYRGFSARVSTSHCISSIVIIQTAVRKFLAMKKYKTAQTGVVALQAHTRRHCEQKTYSRRKLAAVGIQKNYRCYTAKKNYKLQRSSCCRIQSIVRAFLQMQKWKKIKTGFSTLAKVYKGQLSQKQLRALESSVLLQSRVRQNLAQRKYMKLRCAVIALQALVRQNQGTRRFQEKRNSAVVVQSLWRAHKGRDGFCRARSAVSVLQSIWRLKKLRNLAQEEREVMDRAATTIQKEWKRFHCCKNYNAVKNSADRIHNAWLSHLYTKRKKAQNEREAEAAKIIQKTWRCYWTRTSYEDMLWVLYRLQARCKGCVERRKFRALRKGMVALQRLYRMKKIEEAHRERCDAAATMIQKTYRSYWAMTSYKDMLWVLCRVQMRWRGYVERTNFLRRRSAIIALQAQWRGAIARKKMIELKDKQNAEAVLIFSKRHHARIITNSWKKYQQRCMMHFYATLLARAVRHFLQRLRKWRINHGINHFQSVWRGYEVRKETSSTVKLLCAKIKVTKQKAQPSQTLKNRTRCALETLLSTKSLTHIKRCCITLEKSTTYSKACCESFIKARAYLVLFELMRSCNRSIPHQDLLKLVLKILANLVRYTHLITDVSQSPSCVEILMDMLQFFRDQEETFLLSANLMLTLTCELAIREQLAAPEMKKRLRAILTILSRKYNLNSRHNIGPISQRQAAESSSITVVKTLLKAIDT